MGMSLYCDIIYNNPERIEHFSYFSGLTRDYMNDFSELYQIYLPQAPVIERVWNNEKNRFEFEFSYEKLQHIVSLLEITRDNIILKYGKKTYNEKVCSDLSELNVIIDEFKYLVLYNKYTFDGKDCKYLFYIQ